jgi:hypothetical protein
MLRLQSEAINDMKKNGGQRLAASLDDVMVEFIDEEGAHGYLVPLKDLKFLPRVGDRVCMPGKPPDDQEVYEVAEVNHNFAADLMTKSEMKLLSINVSLKPAAPI